MSVRSSPTLGMRTSALLRVGSIRFASYYFLAFEAGVIHAGGSALSWAVPAACLWIINCLAIELINRHADRREDEVNRPERTALCNQVGFEAIRVTAIVLWIVLAVVYAVWSTKTRDAVLAAIQAVCWIVGWNYSVGLRFKARRYGAFVALAATFVLPYVLGWATSARLSASTLSILCVPVFIISLSGVKDITDEDGDRLTGYRSTFLALVRRKSAGRLLAVLAAPYLFALLLAAARLAPLRLVALIVLAPGSFLFAVLVRNATSRDETMAVRECLYQFWFLFMATTAWLVRPTAAMTATILAAAAFWTWTSRHLHWMHGLRVAHLASCWTILRRAQQRAGRR